MALDPAVLRARLAAANGLTLRPPLPEATVADFERRHGVTLPDDYRRFLTEVADGIDCDGGPVFALAAGEATLTGAPGGSFPYSSAYAADLMARLAALPARPFSDIMAAPEVQAGQQPGDPPGCLALADLGCGDYSVLVLTGEQRGKLWRLGDFDAPETAALYQGGSGTAQLEFADWLEQWCALMGV